MSEYKRADPRLAAVLALALAGPFVYGAYAVWAQPLSISGEIWGRLLGADAALLIAGTGAMRAYFSWRREGRAAPATLMFSAAPPLVAIGAILAAGRIGAHWMFVALLAALAVQGAWDITGYGIPDLVRRMRPIVFVAALLSLLAALIGS